MSSCVHCVVLSSNKVIKKKLTLRCFSLIFLLDRVIVAAGPEYSGELSRRDDSF